MVSLTDVARTARPRALALAVAELIQNLTHSPRDASPAPANAGTPPALSTPAAVVRTGLRVGVGPELRVLPGGHATLWGGRLWLAASRAAWQLTVDLGGDQGSTTRDAGTITLAMATAGIAAGPRFEVGGAVADVALAAAFGWARAEGSSSQPGVSTNAGTRIVGSVGARIGFEAPAATVVGLRGTLEAGATVASLNAQIDGVKAAGVVGVYVAIGMAGVLRLR